MIIRTPQGQIVYIPNKVVYENPFTNYTKNFERRIDLSCGISYGDDLEKVKKIATEAISSIEKRDKNKDVEFFFTEFGSSSIIMALKKAFDENDIMIPFPIRTLDFGIRGGEKLNTMWNGQEKITGQSKPESNNNDGKAGKKPESNN